MSGKGEIIFLTVCNKRNLSAILDEHTSKLIIEYNALYYLLSIYKPETEVQCDNYCAVFERYRAVVQELKQSGFGEFLIRGGGLANPAHVIKCAQKKSKIGADPKVSIEAKIKEFHRKHRYTHKQIEYRPRPEVPIEELLDENNKLIHRLSTFEENDLAAAFRDFERYKIVQQMLFNRLDGAYATFDLSSAAAPRMIVLLGERCNECGSLYNLGLHHEIQKNVKGRHNILNLQLLCRRCHDMKHDIPFRYNEYANRMCKLRDMHALDKRQNDLFESN